VTNTLRLRERIKDSGLKYQYIADKMGLSRFGLMKKIENETEFKTSEVEKLCEILSIDSLDERMAIFFAKEVENKSTSHDKGD
jgi:transcriptional regulator with XRE-family HTH domain